MKLKPKYNNHDRLPIVYDPISRRMFLKGMGAFLAIPFLPSLIPVAEAQVSPDVFFIFTMISHGRFENAWYPWGTQFNASGVANVRTKKLSEIEGTLGLGGTLRKDFDDIRNKITLIQGLDATCVNGPHDIFIYTGSGRNEAQSVFGPMQNWSIDSILAQSSRVYPTAPPMRALRLNPMEGGQSFSWAGRNEPEPAYGKTLTDTWKVVSAYINPGGNTPAPSNVDPNKRKLLIDTFLNEFKAVVAGGQVSSEDKILLQNSTDHLAELQKKISSASQTPPASPMANIPLPNVTETMNVDTFNERLIDIMVVAMAYRVTRIGTYLFNWNSCMSPNGAVGNYHDPGVHTAHDGDFQKVADWWNHAMKKFAHMTRRMDQYGLLDKSLLMFTSEYSSSTAAHHGHDMPVLTAGSLNGKFVTGEYINYQTNTALSASRGGRYFSQAGQVGNFVTTPRYVGRQFNEIFNSIFAAAGLPPSEYIKTGGTQFGDPTCSASAECLKTGAYDVIPLLANWYKNNYKESKTATLPYFYKG